MTDFLLLLVSLATWLTPMPKLAEGWLIRYGPNYLGAANAEYRGYTLEGYACAGALMSPADLGKTFWIKVKDSAWIGPCLSVDTARRTDFYRYVYELEEIAELTDATLSALGIVNGARGQVWMGTCPPTVDMMPQRYAPPLVWDAPPYEPHPVWQAYPEQQSLEACP